MKNERLVFAGVFVLSLVLFLAPIPPGPLEGRGLDKLVHAIIFACLLASGFLAFPQARLKLSGLLVVYGVLVELLQKSVFDRRTFDSGDVMADLLGLVIGAVIIRVFDVWA